MSKSKDNALRHASRASEDIEIAQDEARAASIDTHISDDTAKDLREAVAILTHAQSEMRRALYLLRK